MTLDTSGLCRIGVRFAYQHNNVMVRRDGDCTPLYWHITECEECRRLRDEDNHENKR